MVLMMAEERLLTVSDVARRLQTSEETVRRWLRSGRLRGGRPGGTRLGWRVSETEVRRFMREITAPEGADAI